MTKVKSQTLFLNVLSFLFINCLFIDNDKETDVVKGELIVTSPSKGKKVISGAKIQVQWESSENLGQYVHIILLENGEFLQNLTSNTANDGNHQVTISGDSKIGSNFQIQVKVNDHISGNSEFFSIEPFKFFVPTDVDSFIVGKWLNIDWLGSSKALVSLDLYKDENFVLSITSNHQELTAFKWKIPGTLLGASDYKIVIEDPSIEETVSSPYFTIVNPWSDSFEPNNSLKTANEIEPFGDLQSHTLAPLDSDFIFFKAKKNWIYKVQAYSSVDLHFYAYKNESSFYHTTGSNHSKWVYSPDTSNYSFQIRRHSSSDTGSFRISVQAYDPNGIANFIEPGQHTSWPSGTTQKITWEPESSIFGRKIKLDLIYNDNVLVNFDDDPNVYGGIQNDGEVNFAFPFGLADDNKYKIRMTNYQDKNRFGYSQEFSISGIKIDKFEPNDNSEFSTTILPDESDLELSLSFSDIDWFSFKGDSGKVYVIRARDSLNFQINGYYSEGLANLPNYVSTSSDSNFVFSWYCDVNGEYLFRISSSQPGEYFLNFNEYSAEEYVFDVTIQNNQNTFGKGDSVKIVWSNGLNMGGKVNINLKQENELITTIQANATNDESYFWVVPSFIPTGENYTIEVTHTISSSIRGESDTFFIDQE